VNGLAAQLYSIPLLLAETTGHGGAHGAGDQLRFFWSSLAAFVVIMTLAVLATRRLTLVPSGLQNFMEFVYETLAGLPVMVMGPRGRQYAPFVATFFLYILVMNLIQFIPGAVPGTASLSITVGLALVAFIGVQYFGFRAHGPRYLAHFFGPVPIKSLPTLLLGLLLLPLELLAEVIRPVSLSFRLYGNIFGEEQVIHALATQLGPPGPFLAVLMLPMQVLSSLLQALVFTLLVTVYLALATETHDEEHEASEAHS